MSDEEVIIKKPNVLGDERHIHPSLSPNYSTKYMTERYLNRVLKLNRGCVLYSFDKSKIIQWLRNIKESETRKAQCLLDRLLNSQIMEVSYKNERLGT